MPEGPREMNKPEVLAPTDSSAVFRAVSSTGSGHWSFAERRSERTPIYYIEDGGSRVFEGDIYSARKTAKSGSRTSSVVTGAGALWTNLTVPYVFDSDVANQSQIMQAMQVWTRGEPTSNLSPRTTQANYILFSVQRPCSATHMWACRAGRSPSHALGVLRDSAPARTRAAIGLWHEQTRQDRTTGSRSNPQNVNKLCFITTTAPTRRDSGAYDFAR